MKFFIIIVASFVVNAQLLQAQTIQEIYVNLYTDSLKRGTYNYINVDGLLSNGKYIPLDSTRLKYEATVGKFLGNKLWIAANETEVKTTITVYVITKPTLTKTFDIFFKQAPDPVLPTEAEVLQRIQKKPKSKSKAKEI